ncbi:heptaprenyl diphosphate synthase [Halarsenatibacter silvermanii]|uniref:Heptaprenyl diphosphate synthase n=2 Tax=Halarsenatibacter silvermanii TaxID=321763 RepID=A0A1G9PAB9_9FIRM|nr:heptaprenyl diphosphate synthase [Halarsenatibacter silvermanii]
MIEKSLIIISVFIRIEVRDFMRSNRTRYVCLVGLLISIGLVLHIVESLIPMSYIVPGAKMGLANIASLLGMVIFGFKVGFLVLFFRIVLGSVIAGTFLSFNFMMSFSGGVLGFLLMGLVYYFASDYFSIIGVSIVGALFHNVGQIFTAMYIISNFGLVYYLPYLALLAIPAGLGIGLTVDFTWNYLFYSPLRGKA